MPDRNRQRSSKIKKICDTYEELTTCELYLDLLEAISRRPVKGAEAFIRDLIIFFKGTKSDFNACRLAEAMLGLSFEKCKRFAVKAGVSPIQREVLTCLLRRKSLWKREPELSQFMKEHGLPDSHSKLEATLRTLTDKIE